MMLLLGCSPKAVTDHELYYMVVSEFGNTIVEVDILSQSLEGKISKLEAYIESENGGISKEGIIRVKCKYSDSKKKWLLDYYETDHNGWNYTPTQSALTSNTNILQDLMKLNNTAIQFRNEQLNYNNITRNITLSDINSLHFNQKLKTETIEFTLTYENNYFKGKRQCVASLVFWMDNWALNTLSYAPIDLSMKEDNVPNIDLMTFKNYMNNNHLDTMLKFESEYLTNTFLTTEIISVSPLEPPTPYSTKNLKETVIINASKNVIEGTTIATIEYSRNNYGWLISNITIDNTNASFKTTEDLIGIWRGHYTLDDKEHYGELVIDQFVEDDFIYEGRYYYGKTNPNDHFSGSYEVKVSLDLENDSLKITAGDWIDSHLVDDKLDFLIHFDLDNNLYFTFDQQKDSKGKKIIFERKY